MIKLLAVILGICAIMASCGDSKPNDLAFDSKTWKQGDPRARYQMKADLIKDDRLVGKTRNEIIDMLGPGDREQQSYLQYEIDNGSLPTILMIARVYLTLIFDDSSQRVREVTVVDA